MIVALLGARPPTCWSPGATSGCGSSIRCGRRLVNTIPVRLMLFGAVGRGACRAGGAARCSLTLLASEGGLAMIGHGNTAAGRRAGGLDDGDVAVDVRHPPPGDGQGEGRSRTSLVRDPDKSLDRVLPPEVQWKAHNYNHLHEAPTVFYAIAIDARDRSAKAAGSMPSSPGPMSRCG